MSSGLAQRPAGMRAKTRSYNPGTCTRAPSVNSVSNQPGKSALTWMLSAAQAKGGAAGLFGQRLGGSVAFIGVACDNGDPGTGLRQATGNPQADAAVPAGDQRRFARQVEKISHAAPPFDCIGVARPLQQ